MYLVRNSRETYENQLELSKNVFEELGKIIPRSFKHTTEASTKNKPYVKPAVTGPFYSLCFH